MDLNLNLVKIISMKINQNKAPHQMGHDHKLGVMPTEILWKDERTNYWKGLQGRFGFSVLDN